MQNVTRQACHLIRQQKNVVIDCTFAVNRGTVSKKHPRGPGYNDIEQTKNTQGTAEKCMENTRNKWKEGKVQAGKKADFIR